MYVGNTLPGTVIPPLNTVLPKPTDLPESFLSLLTIVQAAKPPAPRHDIAMVTETTQEMPENPEPQKKQEEQEPELSCNIMPFMELKRSQVPPDTVPKVTAGLVRKDSEPKLHTVTPAKTETGQKSMELETEPMWLKDVKPAKSPERSMETDDARPMPKNPVGSHIREVRFLKSSPEPMKIPKEYKTVSEPIREAARGTQTMGKNVIPLQTAGSVVSKIPGEALVEGSNNPGQENKPYQKQKAESLSAFDFMVTKEHAKSQLVKNQITRQAPQQAEKPQHPSETVFSCRQKSKPQENPKAEKENDDSFQLSMRTYETVKTEKAAFGETTENVHKSLSKQVAKAVMEQSKPDGEIPKMTFSMKVKPEGLGELTVKMDYQEGKMSLEITASNPETHKILTGQVNELKIALQETNITSVLIVNEKTELSMSAFQNGMFQDSRNGNGYQKAGKEAKIHETEQDTSFEPMIYSKGVLNYRI